ncbi:MAG: OsmC family protein, partial [Candidatus Scalindua sp.]
AGQEDASREPMVFELDEPPVLLGKNLGTNPVEYLLVALSGCLTTSLIAHASAKGIEIKGVESRYEGDLDLRGFLGLSEDVKVGYENIRVYFKINADVSEEQKEELIRMAQKYSPVFNTIASPVPVSVQLEK